MVKGKGGAGQWGMGRTSTMIESKMMVSAHTHSQGASWSEKKETRKRYWTTHNKILQPPTPCSYQLQETPRNKEPRNISETTKEKKEKKENYLRPHWQCLASQRRAWLFALHRITLDLTSSPPCTRARGWRGAYTPWLTCQCDEEKVTHHKFTYIRVRFKNSHTSEYVKCAVKGCRRPGKDLSDND